MFTHYTMTIRFADGNTRYSALVDAPGLLDFGSRYGVGVAINTETGEADCIAVAGDVFTADVENLTDADLAAPDETLAVCDRCGMPAVKVAGQWLHAEYADATFCAIVMRGMA